MRIGKRAGGETEHESHDRYRLTPEEARSFMGLPDVSAAQQAVVEEWQKRAMEAMSAMDPALLGCVGLIMRCL